MRKRSLETVDRTVIIHKKPKTGLQKELDHYKNELKLAKKEIGYLTKIIELMEERTKLIMEKSN